MAQPKRPRRVRVPLAVTDGPVTREDLPYPVVYYPPSAGVFLAFAPDLSAPAALCDCMRLAVENALRLGSQAAVARDLDPAPEIGLDSVLFPESVAAQSPSGAGDPLAALSFVRGLCHRCNLAAPALRYCHDSEGGRFVQHYGWYVAQAYYRLGIEPGTYAYLPDVVPQEIEPYATAVQRAAQALEEAGGILGHAEAPVDAGSRQEMLRIAQRRFASRMYRRACASLDKAIENLVRGEFGFRQVGDGWVSETQLYKVVCRLYPDREVLRRHRPTWLDGLELDIYVPDLQLAFEYQGQQHFYPVQAWGGEEALHAVQARDARKIALCTEQGVRLIPIDYTEPLVETHVRERVAEAT